MRYSQEFKDSIVARLLCFAVKVLRIIPITNMVKRFAAGLAAWVNPLILKVNCSSETVFSAGAGASANLFGNHLS